jgi:hypothetical protein
MFDGNRILLSYFSYLELLTEYGDRALLYGTPCFWVSGLGT